MKQSAVMVMLTEPMEAIPSNELEVISRFLFRRIQGLNRDHQRRWYRHWKRIMAGEVSKFYPEVDRSGPFHARHMTIEDHLFESQDGFPPTDDGRRAFRTWLKVGASHYHLKVHGGAVKFLEMSLSYDNTSDDEMREFHDAAMSFLKSPRALKKLWPAVKPTQRQEMLDTLLANPTEEQGA